MFPKTFKKFSMMLAGIAGAATIAGAAEAADFSGKRIEWIIPFKEGGGSDRWARFYAPLLSEALPGKPVVVVKNVPGGGSTKGANQFAMRAKTDGTQILGTSGSTQFPYLLGDKRVQYDYKDWNVVLASATGGVFYVNPKLGVTSAKDIGKLRSQDLKYGSQRATSLDLIPILSMKMLDIDVKVVFGMKGRGAGRLAFERGEVNTDYQTSSAYLKKSMPLVKEGKAVPLMAWGALDENGHVVRDPNFPNLPSFPEVYEMVHGEKPSGEEWDAWKAFFTAGFPGQKMVFLPKGASQDVIDTYTEAFRKIVTAPDFAQKAQKTLGTYPQSTGKDAQAVKDIATTVPAKAQNFVRGWLTDAYQVKF
ncbi:tripartite tricarboxylate transporter substrate-binding protein [Terasakiella sp. SH-1]|uniref:tripartite tricarboxylate transporter substrate-binding protein n=1 Tax=Terasakiella sp. SH-1 TaxID=2560057 RepID=UPI001981C4F8|nr:tripartite tricarboxylate transporter substrate-binding protein [Terasakiella sp. SH-1]